MANKYFGTDGIRGEANAHPLDCETAIHVGRAIAAFFDGDDSTGRFIIAQDTRISGDMLVSAICAGICSMGKSVHTAGVIPTPAVASLTRKGGFDAGIMISASHNPFADNGIKLFNGEGFKLSDADEAEIEKKIESTAPRNAKGETIQRVGQVHRVKDAEPQYTDFLKATAVSSGLSLNGVKIVIDGSNGAASRIAPALFTDLGATVIPIFCQPDGLNINEGCGSQHPETLAKTVIAEKAKLGLAFDGDADRLIAVDETGKVLTGDQVIAICARYMKTKKTLTNSVVVTTIMSNMGLGIALEKMGIKHIKAGVGDRYVMQEMMQAGAVLGGEDSGHMIFLDRHTTGDGMLAALNLATAMDSEKRPLSELSRVMEVFPQCLVNVNVRSKPELDTVDAIRSAIDRVEGELGSRGRVLVRYSGTQPQCRVMVEGPTKEMTHSLCQRIASAVRNSLG